MKPAIARKGIFLQQCDFDIIHKDGERKSNMQMHYRSIYLTQISKKISNQFLMLLKENMKVTVVF